MPEEAPLRELETGLAPAGKGWFVLNARDAPWWKRGGRGWLCEFEDPEGDASDFSQLGINITVLAPGEPMAMYHWEADQEDFLVDITVLAPGEPMAMYHWEADQEDFLVVAGEALLLIEGEERPLRQWDLVHCPPGAEHAIVGAGTTSCVVVAVGARDRSTGPDWGGYTVDQAALEHGAGVERPTTVAEEAYARFASGELTRYREGLLPD